MSEEKEKVKVVEEKVQTITESQQGLDVVVSDSETKTSQVVIDPDAEKRGGVKELLDVVSPTVFQGVKRSQRVDLEEYVGLDVLDGGRDGRREMDECLHGPCRQGIEGFRLGHIQRHERHTQAAEEFVVFAGAPRRHDFFSGLDQMVGQVTAYESGCSSDDDHSTCLRVSPSDSPRPL